VWNVRGTCLLYVVVAGAGRCSTIVEFGRRPKGDDRWETAWVFNSQGNTDTCGNYFMVQCGRAAEIERA